MTGSRLIKDGSVIQGLGGSGDEAEMSGVHSALHSAHAKVI